MPEVKRKLGVSSFPTEDKNEDITALFSHVPFPLSSVSKNTDVFFSSESCLGLRKFIDVIVYPFI